MFWSDTFTQIVSFQELLSLLCIFSFSASSVSSFDYISTIVSLRGLPTFFWYTSRSGSPLKALHTHSPPTQLFSLFFFFCLIRPLFRPVCKMCLTDISPSLCSCTRWSVLWQDILHFIILIGMLRLVTSCNTSDQSVRFIKNNCVDVQSL